MGTEDLFDFGFTAVDEKETRTFFSFEFMKLV